MITIPTAELTAALAEVLPFAAADKDAYWHGVLIQWDGDHLHFSATDTLSAARITWIPGEGVEADVPDDQPQGLPRFGGDDLPWRVFVSVPSAKEIISTYKLPAKHALVPLTIKITPTGSSLIVERSRETGQSQHLGMWPTDAERALKFPAVDLVTQAAGPGLERDSIEFSAHRLAAFGAATRHGILRLDFTKSGQPVVATAGHTFLGMIYPSGVSSSEANTNNSAFLRHGSGVHTSVPTSEG